MDIGGNFLCVVDSGACRCVRHRRLDLAVLRNLDHLSDRATRKWPGTRNAHSPAEDVSRLDPEWKPAGDKLRLFCFVALLSATLRQAIPLAMKSSIVAGAPVPAS